jgi:transcription elongation factor Elf1
MNINIGTEFKKLTKCPLCKHQDGFEELDSMGTARCSYCGARFTPTISGVMYVGEWYNYTCKNLYNPPLKYKPFPVIKEGR